MTDALRASLIALREEMQDITMHGWPFTHTSRSDVEARFIEWTDKIDALLAGLPGAGEDQPPNVKAFLRDVAENFDCDSDAHKYGTTCRACEAAVLLQSLSARSAPPAEGEQWKDGFQRLRGNLLVWAQQIEDATEGPGDALINAMVLDMRHRSDEIAAFLMGASAPRAEPPTVGPWQDISTAPTDGMFLVTDGKRQMVASGIILAASNNPGVPFHLGGKHWTHWTALPPAPVPEETK